MSLFHVSCVLYLLFWSIYQLPLWSRLFRLWKYCFKMKLILVIRLWKSSNYCKIWQVAFVKYDWNDLNFSVINQSSARSISQSIKWLIRDYWCLQTPASMWRHNVTMSRWHYDDNCNSMRFTLHKFSISENRPCRSQNGLQTPIRDNCSINEYHCAKLHVLFPICVRVLICCY